MLHCKSVNCKHAYMQGASVPALRCKTALLFSLALQATLTYAAELSELSASGGATDAEMAEGVAFFRTIAPLVAEASEADAERVMAVLMSPSAGTEAQASRGG